MPHLSLLNPTHEPGLDLNVGRLPNFLFSSDVTLILQRGGILCVRGDEGGRNELAVLPPGGRWEWAGC